MASLLYNQECCQAVESAPSLNDLTAVLEEFPHLLISKEGIATIVRSIPKILQRENAQTWNLRFLYDIFELIAKLRWDYSGTVTDATAKKEIGYEVAHKDWPIHLLRAYMHAMVDRTNGNCFIQRDMFYTPDWEAIKDKLCYENPHVMLAWIPTVIRYDYKLNVMDPYRDKFIRNFLCNEQAMKAFFLVLADTCIPMDDAFETCTLMAKIARNNDFDENRASTMGYAISPFLEKCQEQDVGWLEEQIHKANIKVEGIPYSEVVANCQTLMVHMSNIIGDAFAAENYFFEVINELCNFYPTYRARDDTANRFERYFGEDAWGAMADITAAIIDSFGGLSNYKDRRPIEQAERHAAIRLEGVIRNLRASHPGVEAEVYKLFIHSTIVCMGRGFRGAADGMQLYTDAIIDTIFANDAKVIESDVDFMDLMMALEADWDEGFAPKSRDERGGGDGGSVTADDFDPNSSTANLSLHAKSGASTHKIKSVMDTGAQNINRAYKKYKQIEGSVDKTLTGLVGKIKQAIEGDQNTILIEGKKFTVLGLLKKILLTVGLFNYSKLKAILILICGKHLRNKARKSERIKLIAELETELEIVEEKIRDASGDDNREAKYDMMRTRAAIKEALTRLKYSTDAVKAVKAASNVKNSYLPKMASAAIGAAASSSGKGAGE